jgi:hypothetical protein
MVISSPLLDPTSAPTHGRVTNTGAVIGVGKVVRGIGCMGYECADETDLRGDRRR